MSMFSNLKNLKVENLTGLLYIGHQECLNIAKALPTLSDEDTTASFNCVISTKSAHSYAAYLDTLNRSTDTRRYRICSIEDDGAAKRPLRSSICASSSIKWRSH
ncbi:hypothetical protein ABKN59_003703 [Abortiporus biennis]